MFGPKILCTKKPFGYRSNVDGIQKFSTKNEAVKLTYNVMQIHKLRYEFILLKKILIYRLF